MKVRESGRTDSPRIVEAAGSDALIRLPVTCICGSDLWPYRGIQPVASPAPVLPLARVAEGYRAMDERRAIKTLLRP
jgi:threonine dehydrogenase-like Zn-dependent dehydrogenase